LISNLQNIPSLSIFWWSFVLRPLISAISAAISVSLLLVTPALSAPVLYSCDFSAGIGETGNWIPKKLSLTHDASSGQVRVIDPIIQHFVGGPIEAEKAKETKGRITFAWIVRTKTGNQTVRMSYRLTVYRDGKPASMSAKPLGYDNSFSGQGTCTQGAL
jgi:hypothetical protein